VLLRGEKESKKNLKIQKEGQIKTARFFPTTSLTPPLLSRKKKTKMKKWKKKGGKPPDRGSALPNDHLTPPPPHPLPPHSALPFPQLLLDLTQSDTYVKCPPQKNQRSVHTENQNSKIQH